MAKEKINPKDSPQYLVITPVEQLIDEGIAFEGETEKDRIVNQFDFSRIREILQRFASQITLDQHETLVRYLKLCLKPESLE